jgi:hypothetical protein
MRPTRPRVLIKLLAATNETWTFVCLGIAAYFFHMVIFSGIEKLVGEAIFVDDLASLEWKWRERPLSTSAQLPTLQR